MQRILALLVFIPLQILCIPLAAVGIAITTYRQLILSRLRCFELDQEATQMLKRESLAAAGIESEHVTFVTVNFAHDDAFAKLVESGYDPMKKTLFLWEAVTLYLSDGDVRKTLRDVREHTAAGSAVVADFYSTRFIAFAQSARNKKALEYTGEGISFGLPFDVDP